MFCMNCGTQLESAISVCPYCMESLQETFVNIKCANREKLVQLCPDINTIINIEFMGRKESFDLHYSRLINTYRFFEKLLNRNKSEFTKNIIKIQDFDKNYVDKLISLAMKDLKKTALLAEAFFYNQKVKQTCESIYEKYVEILNHQFEEIRAIINELINQKIEYQYNRTKEYQRKMENNYKTRWVGYGIKGSVQASLLNAETSILTGTANTMGYISSIVASNIKDNQMKSQIINSKEFRCIVLERYTYAMQEILEWNCKKIDKKLSVSLFGGELQKRAEAEIECFKKKIPKKELIHKFYEILLYNPYCLKLYVKIYSVLEEVTSKDILAVVTRIGNEENIKYLLMQEDVHKIKQCTSFLDDSEEVSKKKFQDLKKLAGKNFAYNDCELATSNIVCDYKDKYVRNWFQGVGNNIRNTVGHYSYGDVASSIQWERAENNSAYAYMVYCVYETNASNLKYDIYSKKQLLEENKGLQNQIKNGNKSAICVWAALNVKFSIAHKKPVSKYAEIIWKLSDQGNALAMSLAGEWLDKGIADCSENKYIADMLFRMAMLQGNPYAISYIGYYYQNGLAGYPKDKNFANDLFDLSIEVPLSRKQKGKKGD